ncbi:MAG: hypothetical protein JNL79_15575 [Myxococcales bacterium]|nr:hypothetical protein [Myxococcales bacterium]
MLDLRKYASSSSGYGSCSGYGWDVELSEGLLELLWVEPASSASRASPSSSGGHPTSFALFVRRHRDALR